MTKKLLLSVAAAAALMSSVPAFAQADMHESRTKLYDGRAGAYVRYFGTTKWNPYNDPNAVFVAGTYVGSDPDPNIRAALIREFGRRR